MPNAFSPLVEQRVVAFALGHLDVDRPGQLVQPDGASTSGA